jgi:site-specific DNA-methyltransferase (adenine-specific)
MPDRQTHNGHGDSGGASRFFYVAKAPARERPKVDGTAHPTVKPLTLMRWLCRLVTPPDGVILEPFAGSGTTVEAALLEGFRVVAIEREAEYLPLIQARLDRVAATEPDDEQLTLDASA